MPKILIVEDEPQLARFVQLELEHEEYETVISGDGREGLTLAEGGGFDLILLDIMLPGLNGLEVLRRLRKAEDHTPVIMLTARDSVMDKVSGLDMGADDYITKPFAIEELMARIRAVLNRASASQRTEDVIRYEGLEINFTAREVKIDGKKVSMTPKEYDLLFYLVKNMNIALSREKLLEEVWGFDFYGDDRTVDTHIKMLRNSLGKYRNLIVTLRGMGYKFEKIQ